VTGVQTCALPIYCYEKRMCFLIKPNLLSMFFIAVKIQNFIPTMKYEQYRGEITIFVLNTEIRVCYLSFFELFSRAERAKREFLN